MRYPPRTKRSVLGSGWLANPRTVRDFWQEADVIFGVGCSFSETVFGIQVPPGKTIFLGKHYAVELHRLG